MRARGEIQAIGAGINHTGMIARLLERFDIDFFLVAMPYTLANQDALKGELQLCEKRGVKVVVGAVFASGILATGAIDDARYGYQSAPDEILDKVRRIARVCERFGVPLSAAALQFPLGHPSVVSVIPGANSSVQVNANVAAFRHNIAAGFWSALRAEKLIDARAPTPTD